MFTLEHNREHLWQWDSNQRILVEDPTITEVHFCNKTTPNSLVVETYTDDTYDGKVYAEIPNILLQEDWDICVYAFCNCYTKVEERIKVKARSKPSDYVYTETEVLNYNTLLARMDAIDENIGQSIEDYLTEHPIEAGATTEQVAQINKNKEDIENLNTEIDNLPTKEYVDNEVKNVKVDLTGYATEQYVDTIIADINECDTYFFNPFEVEWASGLKPTPAPDSLAEFAQRVLNGDGVSLYVAYEVSEGDRRWAPCEVYISANEVKFHRCALHSDFGKEVHIQTYRVYESTSEGYDWCVQGTASMSLKYDLKYATESYVNNAIANIDIPEGSGSQEVFYFNLIGYTSWKAVTDDMATVLDRMANGERLCIYAKESYAYAVADVLVTSATNITFLLHYTDYMGGTTARVSEYLAMKLNGVWEIGRQSATTVTFATKQYVDDAVANSGGLTTDQVQEMIDSSLGVIENGSY